MGHFLGFFPGLGFEWFIRPDVKVNAVAGGCVGRTVIKVCPNADSYGSNVPVGDGQGEDDTQAFAFVRRVQLVGAWATATSFELFNDR